MSQKQKLLLIGWDAADWEHITPLLDDGKLPVLESLINRGVMGNLATLQPVLSPMLWNSVATGKQPWKHGIHGFMEPDPIHGGSRPWSSQSRGTKALWNMLSQSGLRSNVVNWWAGHPAEKIDGCVVSNLITGIRHDQDGKWHMPRGAVHPESMAGQLAPLAVLPGELTHQQILPFVPRAAEIDQDNDNRLSLVAKNLADMLTTHNIATAVMAETDWEFMAVYYTAIDHFCHAFIPYHPPRLPWIPESDFELYKDVVNSAYRFSDMTLGRLLELAGPETTVILCSDHGFQSRELRLRVTPNEPAGPAYWHRKYGVFLAAGPGIRRDERVYGATLLDIAPTVLHWFGLPVGEDMDGRVLGEIFETESSVEYVPSWDELDSDRAGFPAEPVATTPQEAEELFNQFVALGYVEDVGDSQEDQRRVAEVEARFNLARNLDWCGKQEEACQLFERLVCDDPWETRFLLHLAKCLLACRRFADTRQLIERAWDLEQTREWTAVCYWADAVADLGSPDLARQRLLQLESTPGLRPGVLLRIGATFNRIGNYEGAERLMRRILEMHPDNAEAHLVLSELMLRRNENQAAADHALESVALIYNQARAHLNLGIALARGSDFEKAEFAFGMALKIRPNLRRAHRWLAVIHAGPRPDPEKAQFHRKRAAELAVTARRTRKADASRGIDHLPEFPSELERVRLLVEKRAPRANPAIPSGKTFVLVSGLPRSGTSLMMQMLEQGGLPPKTDGARTADPDNPRGYFEWEEIKQVGRRPEILNEEGLDGKAIKVVSALLRELPYQHKYKVIFMNRPVREVVASQQTMIQRQQNDGADLTEDELLLQLELHRQASIAWLQNHPRAEVLVVDYPRLLSDPDPVIREICEFTGSDLLPAGSKMRQAIDPELWRNRSKDPQKADPEMRPRESA